MVGHEEGVELSALQFPYQLPDMRKIEIGVRPGAGIAPRPGVNRDRPHERAELELPFCHRPISISDVVAMEIGMPWRKAITRSPEDYCNLRPRNRRSFPARIERRVHGKALFEEVDHDAGLLWHEPP